MKNIFGSSNYVCISEGVEFENDGKVAKGTLMKKGLGTLYFTTLRKRTFLYDKFTQILKYYSTSELRGSVVIAKNTARPLYEGNGSTGAAFEVLCSKILGDGTVEYFQRRLVLTASNDTIRDDWIKVFSDNCVPISSTISSTPLSTSTAPVASLDELPPASLLPKTNNSYIKGDEMSSMDDVQVPKQVSQTPDDSTSKGGRDECICELKQIESDAQDMKPPAEGQICRHVYIEQWGDEFVCCDCVARKEKSYKVTDADKCAAERESAKKLGDEDPSMPEDSADRGLTIQFLIDFCTAFNLWDVSTRNVRRHYIIPMTSRLRCRFVDLPTVQRSGAVGKAATFVSHSWDAKFGDLVTSIADGADYRRRVWVDIFSVRQWPTTKPDLCFEVVVERCPSFLIFCPSLLDLETLVVDWEVLASKKIAPEIMSRIPFFRVWCLYEIFYAAVTGAINIVFKAGSYAMVKKDGKSLSYRFEENAKMLKNLYLLIDVTNASATNPVDRPMIFNKLASYAGGVDGFNVKCRDVIGCALSACYYPEVQCAVCGDAQARATVLSDPIKYLYIVASGGYTDLLQALLERNPHIYDNKYINDETALFGAAASGNLSCLQFLIRQGADVRVRSKDGNTPIGFASSTGHLSCLEALIHSGADVNAQNNTGFTPLMNACIQKDLLCVEALLLSGSNVNIQTEHGLTALMFATKSGNTSCMELLIRGGADVNITTDDDITALRIAIQEDHLACMAILINCGANINATAKNGYSILNSVTKVGNLAALELLISSGADVNIDAGSELTALMHACKINRVPFVEFLLSRSGVDVNQKKEGGLTALMVAAKEGAIHCMELLIRYGADVNAQCEIIGNGFTSLIFAFEGNHISCMELLILSGADVNVRATHGLTTLAFAALGGNLPCVKLLVQSGADVNAKDLKGSTSLMFAYRGRHLHCMEYLISNGADVNAKEDSGFSALMFAVRECNLPCMELLIRSGADIHARTGFGIDCLMLSAQVGNLPCMDLLIHSGADVNARGPNGMTSLFLAANGGHRTCMECLLFNGADVNASTATGFTTLMYAANGGFLSCLECLIQGGAEVNARGLNGFTGLMLACKGNHLLCAEFLLCNGSDIDARADNGFTTLMLAAKDGNLSGVEFLIRRGADVHAQCENGGETSLSLALEGGHAACVELLLLSSQGETGNSTRTSAENVVELIAKSIG